MPSSSIAVWEDLAMMADKAAAAERVVKHFAPPRHARAELGLTPSVLASDRNAQEAAKQGRIFCRRRTMDDLRRQG